MPSNEPTITLFGNVGKDPEARLIPGRDIVKKIYDPIVDEVVEKTIPLPERELRTFSLAVNYTDPETGEEEVRWKYCEDWNGLSALNLVRQGDRLRLTGYFREHCYEKDGERKTARSFVVQDLQVLRRRRAPEVA
jgi:single-stranded DNA-binding protein